LRFFKGMVDSGAVSAIPPFFFIDIRVLEAYWRAP